MKRILIPALCGLALLSACTPTQQDNGAACGLALAASGVKDAQALVQLALITPACQALAADVLQAAIAKAAQRGGQ